MLILLYYCTTTVLRLYTAWGIYKSKSKKKKRQGWITFSYFLSFAYYHRYIQQHQLDNGQTPLRTVVHDLLRLIDGNGLSTIEQFQHEGNLSRPRTVDIVAALNRLRVLRTVQVKE
jgi:hypothetical protein